MKTVSCHHAWILAAALAAALAGCADVHQDPATSTINGQPAATASQATNAQSPASVPF